MAEESNVVVVVADNNGVNVDDDDDDDIAVIDFDEDDSENEAPKSICAIIDRSETNLTNRWMALVELLCRFRLLILAFMIYCIDRVGDVQPRNTLS